MPERRKPTRAELRKRQQMYFRRRVFVAVVFVLILFIIYFIISGIVSLFTKGDVKSSSVGASSITKSSSQQTSSQSSLSSSSAMSSMPVKINSLDNLNQRSEWNLLLVSNKFMLMPNFQVTTAKATQIDAVMDSRVIEQLDKMITEAKRNQINLVSSNALSYRNRADAQKMFDSKVEELKKQGLDAIAAQTEALKTVPQAGTSEHETGLGIDLVTKDNLSRKAFDTSNAKEYIWLKNNCATYGFIPRYPSDKATITGVSNEPFHYRYVGIDNAKKIMKNNLCLEEYLIKLQNGETLE